MGTWRPGEGGRRTKSMGTGGGDPRRGGRSREIIGKQTGGPIPRAQGPRPRAWPAKKGTSPYAMAGSWAEPGSGVIPGLRVSGNTCTSGLFIECSRAFISYFNTRCSVQALLGAKCPTHTRRAVFKRLPRLPAPSRGLPLTHAGQCSSAFPTPQRLRSTQSSMHGPPTPRP